MRRRGRKHRRVPRWYDRSRPTLVRNTLALPSLGKPTFAARFELVLGRQLRGTSCRGVIKTSPRMLAENPLQINVRVGSRIALF